MTSVVDPAVPEQLPVRFPTNVVAVTTAESKRTFPPLVASTYDAHAVRVATVSEDSASSERVASIQICASLTPVPLRAPPFICTVSAESVPSRCHVIVSTPIVVKLAIEPKPVMDELFVPVNVRASQVMLPVNVPVPSAFNCITGTVPLAPPLS